MKNDGTKVLTYNWTEIQNDYDKNELMWDDLQDKYNLSTGMLCKATKLNLFKSRTRGQSASITARKHPQKHTEETKRKISEIRRKFLAENPDKVPYLLNHKHKKMSYAEQYFTDCFKNTSLASKHRILAYELDFAHVENKIDIEIDGDQHFLDPVIVEHDKRRNQTLIELGWTIYRIRWSEFQKETRENKEIIVKSIIDLNPINTKCLLILDAQPNQEKIDKYFEQSKTRGMDKCLCGNSKYKTSKQCGRCYSARITVTLPNNETLQKLLTEKSIREICKEFQVSRTALIRHCKICNINHPIFPKGYWQKRQAGFTHEQAITPAKPKNMPKRFTKEQIIEIRRLISENNYIAKIARIFNVDRHTISNIRDGKTYKDIV